MNFTEDKTGLGFARFSFTSPSGMTRKCILGAPATSGDSGNIYRGTVARTCEFPRGSEVGNWSLDVVEIYDRAASRNSRSYQGSELDTLAALWGFPALLTLVDDEPTRRLEDGTGDLAEDIGTGAATGMMLGLLACLSLLLGVVVLTLKKHRRGSLSKIQPATDTE